MGTGMQKLTNLNKPVFQFLANIVQMLVAVDTIKHNISLLFYL